MSEPSFDREPRSTALVAFKDCDAFGLLYNTRYLDYIMDARAEHLIKYYGLDFHRQLQRTQQTWVVQGHQIEYLEPARVHEEITLRSRMLHFNSNTCLLEGLMLNRAESRLKSVHWIRLSYVNLPRGNAQSHPEEVLAFLSRVRAENDVPEPLDFDIRVKQLRAKFNRLTQER